MNHSHSTALNTHQPVYTAMFDHTGSPERNTRRVRCAHCQRELKPGQGYKWDYSALGRQYVLNAHVSYYCPACQAEKMEYLTIAPRIDEAMVLIEKWCRRWVTLSMGWHATQHIKALVRSSHLAGADVAEAIRSALPGLELDDTSYGAVIRLAREIVYKTVQPEGCDDC